MPRDAPPTRAPRRRPLATGLVLAGLLAMASCTEQPATPEGQDVRRLFYVILALAAFVFVVVEGGLLWAIIRYRRRPGDDAEPPQWYGSTRMLVLFFLFGAVIVAVLFPFGEATLARVQAHPPAVEQIQIQGSQWQWSAFYGNEGVITSGKSFGRPLVMELPVDEIVHIHLISSDVMHEFFVPAFLFMKNAIPGHPNDFTFTPTRLGTFHGQCAEFCGLGHARMMLVVKVVTPEVFQAWVQKERRAVLGVSCPPASGNRLQLVAHNITWNKNCLAITAGQAASVTVQNLDAGIDHNFAIWDGIDTQHQFFATGRFAGVATRTFTIPSLSPGKYYFQCNIHGPAMSGAFIVKGPTGGS
jgi:cytochrome c oxidase subunit II